MLRAFYLFSYTNLFTDSQFKGETIDDAML